MNKLPSPFGGRVGEGGQQTTNNKQQTTNNKQQTTNNKQQTINNKPKPFKNEHLHTILVADSDWNFCL